MYKKGDKVLYNNKEKGIVRHTQTERGDVFVVFNCGEDWDNFENYTASNTPTGLLTKGWEIYGTTEWCKANGGCEFIPSQSKWSSEGQSYCVGCGRSN